MIEGIRNFSYERRLKLLKLDSLERRRVRDDLFEVFKWVKGFNKRKVGKILRISSQDKTRNNGFILEKCRYRLSQQVVSAQTMGNFKRKLDGFMDGDERWV